MAFERIAVTVGRLKGPARICISKHGKTYVSIRGDLVQAAGFKVDDKYAVLLGREEDTGKLRIVKAKDGVACARELRRTGAFFFNLGMVPAVGTLKCPQRQTDARAIEDGVEVDIPEMGLKLLPAPANAAAEQGDADELDETGGDEGDAAPRGEQIGDVWICQVEDQESITFAGKTIAVSLREAKFLALLARARPNTVAPSFIISKLWPEKVPATAGLMVGQLVTDLKKSLPSIGLTVNLVKGVGYQLRDA